MGVVFSYYQLGQEERLMKGIMLNTYIPAVDGKKDFKILDLESLFEKYL